MSILTVDDKDLYFPDVTVSGNSLVAIINSMQNLAESGTGADRPLEISLFRELRSVPSNGLVQLTYTPVVYTDDYPFTVDIRYRKGLQTPSDYSGTDEWYELTGDDFTLDTHNNELKINSFFGEYARFYGDTYGSPFANVRQRRKRVLGKYDSPQIRISYYAGFDFSTDPLSFDARLIKTALGAMVNYRGSSAGVSAAQGISNYELENFYKVQFSPNNNKQTLTKKASSLIDEQMVVFQKYRPREFF